MPYTVRTLDLEPRVEMDASHKVEVMEEDARKTPSLAALVGSETRSRGRPDCYRTGPSADGVEVNNVAPSTWDEKDHEKEGQDLDEEQQLLHEGLQPHNWGIRSGWDHGDSHPRHRTWSQARHRLTKVPVAERWQDRML